VAIIVQQVDDADENGALMQEGSPKVRLGEENGGEKGKSKNGYVGF